MIKSYKYRIYPNKQQVTLLNKTLDHHCMLYNLFLEERIGAYQVFRKSISGIKQSYQIKEIREDIPSLKAFSYSSMQQTVRKLDKAFNAFFSRVKSGQTPGFPRFKPRKRFNSFASVFGDGSGIKKDKLYIQGVGNIKVKWHRALPESSVVKQIVIKQQNNKWYATFQIDDKSTPAARTDYNPIGIDLGIESFAVLSDGASIENHRYFVKSEKKLRRLNRALARKTIGSHRWKQVKHQIQLLHEKVANQRQDFLHKTSRSLCNQYSLIAMEDLKITDMKNDYLNKSIADVGWGYFRLMLEYKSIETGTALVKVNPAYTSQDCSGCGNRVIKSLNQRTHFCESCGLELDRDHNAALNILRLGLSLQALTQTNRSIVA